MACSCDPPKPAIEFYLSEYVFEGTVISKAYPADSLTYTVTFEILKHYKQGDAPKQLDFTFKSEGRYHGEITSCDWDVNMSEKWLIYAYRNKGKLVFEYMCGNSKPLGIKEIYPAEQKVLDFGNDFDPSKYIFTRFDGINIYSNPLNSIDYLLKKHQYTMNTPTRVEIMVDVNEKGQLISANLTSKQLQISDPVFNLIVSEKVTFTKPANQPAKNFLKIVRALKTWQVAFIPHSTTAIKYRRYLQFYY